MLPLLALLTDLSVASVTSDDSTVADRRLSRMADLYEQVCLTAFPNDKTAEALMSSRQARRLTSDEVKVTLRDDPAEGWSLAEDGGPTVWIEFPPYHACSVRWNSPYIGDLKAYYAVTANYKSANEGFYILHTADRDQGDIHIHMIGEQRKLPNGSTESLFIIDQSITDPGRRAKGFTGHSIRFVHQFTPANPG